MIFVIVTLGLILIGSPFAIMALMILKSALNQQAKDRYYS